MVTFVPPNQMGNTATRKSLGYDFALLGLRSREARVDVIRNAAEKTAARIPEDTHSGKRLEMLTELATATYRLLDPRLRTKPLERIQLSILSESEPVLATVARKPLVRGPVKNKLVPTVTAELVEPKVDLVQPSTGCGFHKVSYICESDLSRKLIRKNRVGVIALSVLTTLIASTVGISWLLFC